MMPLQVIITAANTVSRGRDAAFGPPESIEVTIKATSMTVTATAKTSDPNGSPTRRRQPRRDAPPPAPPRPARSPPTRLGALEDLGPS